MEPSPSPSDLIDPGWERVEQALLTAGSEDHLIVHWFLTPHDAATHSDPHWHDNHRVEKFVRVVVPTLADQLEAAMLTVAVPWDVTEETATITIIAAVAGQPAVIAARRARRSRLADAPPYWWLERSSTEPPAALARIVASLTI